MSERVDDQVGQRIAAELARHPAVSSAAVRGDDRLIAHVVPDDRYAPAVYRACRMVESGSLAGLSLHEPAGKLLVAQLNRTETDFLYREIFEENAYLRHGVGLPANPVVVDVGANIGMFCLLIGLRSGDARIIAVEPVAELARAASINAELHGIDVTMLNCCLGDHSGEVTFSYYPNNTLMSGMYGDIEEDRAVLGAYLRTAPEVELGTQFDRLVEDRMRAQPRRCQITTLTELVATHVLDRIDLLKIDVEKAEADVLAGIDPATWEKIDQIVLEVHDINGRLATVLDHLNALGFDTAHEQDRRLKLTPCHNVYARRPGARPSRSGQAPPARTRSALTAELHAFLVGQAAELPPPDEIVWVAQIDTTDAPAQVRASCAGRASAVLSGAWRELFGAGSDRPDADFFDLGGNSLTAVRLLAKIETQLGEEVIEPDLIFTTTRFADLADAIAETLRSRDQVDSG